MHGQKSLRRKKEKRKIGQNRGSYPWTQQQLFTLRNGWQDLIARQLVKDLKPHTWLAIRKKAEELGLPAGVPQGRVSIKEAARICGVDKSMLLRVLAIAKVKTPICYGRLTWTAARRHVCPDEAREAMTEYLATESTTDAAQRLRISRDSLLRRAAAEGRPLLGRGVKVRMLPQQWDELLQKHPIQKKRKPKKSKVRKF